MLLHYACISAILLLVTTGTTGCANYIPASTSMPPWYENAPYYHNDQKADQEDLSTNSQFFLAEAS